MIEIWITLTIVALTLVLLATTRISSDLVLIGALTLLILFDILSPAQAFSGFSSTGLATVAVLYIVVAGVIETGLVSAVSELVLGRPTTVFRAQLRLMLPVTAVSAFLNNTPVVGMMVPAIQEWARRNRLPVSKLMIPLSYAAIFGGTCTVIGTSTNLIVSGMVNADPNLPAVGFFEIAWVGMPCAIAGILFVLLASRWLLPVRQAAAAEVSNAREYAVEMLVEVGSPMEGRTIEQAGLRNLPGLYLAEIQRGDNILPAVAPTERLHEGDRLIFVGAVDSVADLNRIRGLVPAADQIFKIDSPRPERKLIEAVVSPTSPLTGLTIREAKFRTRYEAVILSVARGGRRVEGKIGDIRLQAGDTLLVEARPSFVDQHRNSRDFLLVSALDGGVTPRHDRAGLAGAILAGMVFAAAFFGVDMLAAALMAAAAMLLTRCTTAAAARRHIDWQVLVVIGAALGLGQALDQSGAAALIADTAVNLAGANPWLVLLAVYLVTNLMTEVVTNNAAAVMMFPVAKAAALGMGVSFTPFIFVIMMAASASFATPIGYQTNLMVYGPGGYRFTDYLRMGSPLNLVLAMVTMIVVPLVWPLQ